MEFFIELLRDSLIRMLIYVILRPLCYVQSPHLVASISLDLDYKDIESQSFSRFCTYHFYDISIKKTFANFSNSG